ncbi:MAG: hypothetical protein WCD57_01740 [Acidobacteriaceae bacterium]
MPERKTRITVEQDTIMIVRRANVERSWCPLCTAEVDVVAVGDKVLAEILATGTGLGWIVSGDLHVSHQPDGTTRICLASLLRCSEPQPAQPTNIAKETL